MKRLFGRTAENMIAQTKRKVNEDGRNLSRANLTRTRGKSAKYPTSADRLAEAIPTPGASAIGPPSDNPLSCRHLEFLWLLLISVA